MEIKSRGVDPIAVKKIDELAANQGISRSAFVANLIQKCMTVIDNNTKVMQDVLNVVGEQE